MAERITHRGSGKLLAGVNIASGSPRAQSLAHHTFRRLLGRSTAREGVLLFRNTTATEGSSKAFKRTLEQDSDHEGLYLSTERINHDLKSPTSGGKVVGRKLIFICLVFAILSACATSKPHVWMEDGVSLSRYKAFEIATASNDTGEPLESDVAVHSLRILSQSWRLEGTKWLRHLRNQKMSYG